MWLLALYMTGAEKDVSEQIKGIDEEIGRSEERTRLTEEFWKMEIREGKELGGLIDKPDAASDNGFEDVTSAQKVQRGIKHDKNRNKETINQKHEKGSLVAVPLRSVIPSKIPATRQLHTPLETCKISTITTTRAATIPDHKREIASSSRDLKSGLIASTLAAGSKIGMVNFSRQPPSS